MISYVHAQRARAPPLRYRFWWAAMPQPRRDDSVKAPPDYGLGAAWVWWRGGCGWGAAWLYYVVLPNNNANWFALVGDEWRLLLDRPRPCRAQF